MTLFLTSLHSHINKKYISVYELVEATSGSPALRLERDKNEDKMLRVNGIKYVKFPWWKFWKKRKYVAKYYLEVMWGNR